MINSRKWPEVARQQRRSSGGPAGEVEVRGLGRGQYSGSVVGRLACASTYRDRCERRRTSGRGGRSSKRSCGSSGAVVRHSRPVRFPVRQLTCPLSRAGARVGGQIRGGRSRFVWRTGRAHRRSVEAAASDGQLARLRGHWAILADRTNHALGAYSAPLPPQRFSSIY